MGLTLAQGCRENGIDFEIAEKDEHGKRAQGWAITLHVSLRRKGDKKGLAVNELVMVMVVMLMGPLMGSLIDERFFTSRVGSWQVSGKGVKEQLANQTTI